MSPLIHASRRDWTSRSKFPRSIFARTLINGNNARDNTYLHIYREHLPLRFEDLRLAGMLMENCCGNQTSVSMKLVLFFIVKFRVKVVEPGIDEFSKYRRVCEIVYSKSTRSSIFNRGITSRIPFVTVTSSYLRRKRSMQKCSSTKHVLN